MTQLGHHWQAWSLILDRNSLFGQRIVSLPTEFLPILPSNAAAVTIATTNDTTINQPHYHQSKAAPNLLPPSLPSSILYKSTPYTTFMTTSKSKSTPSDNISPPPSNRLSLKPLRDSARYPEPRSLLPIAPPTCNRGLVANIEFLVVIKCHMTCIETTVVSLK